MLIGLQPGGGEAGRSSSPWTTAATRSRRGLQRPARRRAEPGPRPLRQRYDPGGRSSPKRRARLEPRRRRGRRAAAAGRRLGGDAREPIPRGAGEGGRRPRRDPSRGPRRTGPVRAARPRRARARGARARSRARRGHVGRGCGPPLRAGRVGSGQVLAELGRRRAILGGVSPGLPSAPQAWPDGTLAPVQRHPDPPAGQPGSRTTSPPRGTAAAEIAERCLAAPDPAAAARRLSTRRSSAGSSSTRRASRSATGSPWSGFGAAPGAPARLMRPDPSDDRRGRFCYRSKRDARRHRSPDPRFCRRGRSPRSATAPA